MTFSTRSRTVALVAVAAALATGFVRATASPLPKGWSHAQVNVVTKHVPHTLIYDRGVIMRVSRVSLTLNEKDGSVVAIQVAPSVNVTLDGRSASIGSLRRGEFAQAVRVDGNPAVEIQAQTTAAADARRDT